VKIAPVLQRDCAERKVVVILITNGKKGKKQKNCQVKNQSAAQLSCAGIFTRSTH